METFLTFGLGNLFGAIYMIAFNLIFIPKAKNKTNKEKLKPIKYAWYILIILEVLKISFHISYYKEFSTGIYPILYCSLPLYLIGVILYKDEKSPLYRASYVTLIIPFMVIGLALLCIYPSRDTIEIDGMVLNFHSRFYHLVLMGISIYLCHIKCIKFEFKDSILIGILNASYVLLSGLLSISVCGPVSFFSPLAKEIKFVFDLFGYLPGALILCTVVFILSFLFYGVCSIITRKDHKYLK